MKIFEIHAITFARYCMLRVHVKDYRNTKFQELYRKKLFSSIIFKSSNFANFSAIRKNW